jgi:hypothetical protein
VLEAIPEGHGHDSDGMPSSVGDRPQHAGIGPQHDGARQRDVDTRAEGEGRIRERLTPAESVVGAWP